MSRLLNCCVVSLSLVASAQDGGAAAGWYVSGQGTASYLVSAVDPGVCGTRAARVSAKSADAKGPVAVMQTFLATAYRGARVRYAATVDVRDVTGWAGLFFRADGAQKKTLAFDDLRARPLRGTRACARVSVVVQVPKEAELLSLGLSLEGPGALELSDVALERVDGNVALTAGLSQTHGRVGNVWFTDALVSTSQAIDLRMKLPRRAPGDWRDSTGDMEARVEGEQVVARMYKVDTGSMPMVFSGSLRVKHADGVTTIEGEWGTQQQKNPVRITLSPEALDMKWGFYERHLKAEPAPQLQEGCRFYAQKAGGTAYSDALEVCGGVLSATPPPVQTVMAFLANGFRRLGTGLSVPPPAVAPVPPAQLR